MNGTEHSYNEALDIGVYDVYKCFDLVIRVYKQPL